MARIPFLCPARTLGPHPERRCLAMCISPRRCRAEAPIPRQAQVKLTRGQDELNARLNARLAGRRDA